MKISRRFCPVSVVASLLLAGAAGAEDALDACFEQAEDLSKPLGEIVARAVKATPACKELDDIDGILLASSVSAVSPQSISSTYSGDRVQGVYNSTYNSMASIGASRGEAMNAAGQQAGAAAYSALLAKSAAEDAAREARKRVIRFRSFYKRGSWKEALREKINPTPGDMIMMARALRRAGKEGHADGGGDMKCLELYNAGLIAGCGGGFAPSQKIRLFWEIQGWHDSLAGNAGAEQAKAAAKTSLGGALAFFKSSVSGIGINEGVKIARRVARLAVQAGDGKIYEDAERTIDPKAKAKSGPREFDNDEAFLIMACYQEATGNKPMTLDIYRSYQDYANFSPAYKMKAIYLDLADSEVKRLEKEVGIKALPHVNRLLGVDERDIRKQSEEKKTDEKRKQMGLEWEE